MKKLNKNRQQMYLDGKVGLINDGTVEQLREVTTEEGYLGAYKYYALGRCSQHSAKEGIDYKPTSWFYEEEAELPKVGEWWECVEDVFHTGKTRFTKGNKYACKDELGTLVCNELQTFYINMGVDYRSHFIKSTAPDQQPTAWKLNVDVPEWGLEKGITARTICDLVSFLDNNKQPCLLPISILQHIATPIYHTPFTLENGTTINLTAKDIENIKKL